MNIYLKMAHYSSLNIEFIYMNTNEKFTYCHVFYLVFILEHIPYLLELIFFLHLKSDTMKEKGEIKFRLRLKPYFRKYCFIY